MAFGVSSLAILSGLRDGGQNGKLISIDPHQCSGGWKGAGVAAVARAALNDRHELIEDYDYNVLPRLLSSGLKIDFAYIDGWHTFDYVLLDYWYIDKMLTVGGVVGFNDCSWPAIDKVIRFVLTHRKYSEIEVGLPVEFASLSRRRELLRRLTFGDKRQWCSRVEDRYFKKGADWEPKWDFFVAF
ncbi:MAG TPA: class I SAM-dependent methyltransferase [Candidatus Acidoferrum sp.]|nr:class I SAM-dependent methyltransferase [Candidatus Acidoferrum sp.]